MICLKTNPSTCVCFHAGIWKAATSLTQLKESVAPPPALPLLCLMMTNRRPTVTTKVFYPHLSFVSLN